MIKEINSNVKKKELDIDSSSKQIGTEDLLNLMIRHLKEEHNFSNDDIIKLVKEDKKEIKIPVSIFNEHMSSLEAVVKYLVEVVGLKNKEIALLLNRNIRTIWTTYKNASRKDHNKIRFRDDEIYFIPATKFKDRTYSVLEVIVMWLKEKYSLSFEDIAGLIKRDNSTVWTVYSRAMKKVNNK